METPASEHRVHSKPPPEPKDRHGRDTEARIDATLLLISAVLFVLYVLGILPWIWQIFSPG